MMPNEAAFKILKEATKYTQKGKTRRGGGRRRISSSDCQLQKTEILYVMVYFNLMS